MSMGLPESIPCVPREVTQLLPSLVRTVLLFCGPYQLVGEGGSVYMYRRLGQERRN